MLENQRLVLVWAAPPCGTATRAREKKIPQRLRQAGVPEPKPLRTDARPEGLEGLSGTNKDRVDSANVLYKFTAEFLTAAHAKGIWVVVENPRRSLMWATSWVVKFTSKPGMFTIDYDACQHGGDRQKKQRLWSNWKGLRSLGVLCSGEALHISTSLGREERTGNLAL